MASLKVCVSHDIRARILAGRDHPGIICDFKKLLRRSEDKDYYRAAIRQAKSELRLMNFVY